MVILLMCLLRTSLGVDNPRHKDLHPVFVPISMSTHPHTSSTDLIFLGLSISFFIGFFVNKAKPLVSTQGPLHIYLSGYSFHVK